MKKQRDLGILDPREHFQQYNGSGMLRMFYNHIHNVEDEKIFDWNDEIQCDRDMKGGISWRVRDYGIKCLSFRALRG